MSVPVGGRVVGFLSLRRLAAITAGVSLLATLVAYQFFFALVMVPAGVTVGLLAYVLFGDATSPPGRTLEALTVEDDRLPTVLSIGFFIAMAASMAVVTTAYYTLPVSYYVAIAAAAGVLFVRIALTEAVRSNFWYVVLYALNLFGSSQLAFPRMVGPDGAYHIRHVTAIYETGHVIGEPTTYSGFPGQHLGPATLAHLAGIQPGNAYLLVGVALMTVGMLLVYCVGVRFSTRRYALIVMLVYASMSYVVYRGSHPTQQGHIVPIFLLLYVVTFYLFFEFSRRNRLLFLVVSGTLIITHHHTSLIAIVMLGALLAGLVWADSITGLLNRLVGQRVRRLSQNNTAMTKARGLVLLVVFSTIYWTHIFFTSRFTSSAVGYFWSFFQTLFEQDTAEPLQQAPRFVSIPPETFLLNTAGEGLLFMLAVIGGLTFLVYQNRAGVMILAWLAAAGALAVLGVAVDFAFVIPQRIYLMAQVTAIGFLAAAGLVYLVGHIGRPGKPGPVALRVGAVVCLVCLFVFFSTGSTIAGFESSLFNEGVPFLIEYDVAEEDRAAMFRERVGVDESELRYERQLAELDGTINYSKTDRPYVQLNRHRASTGVVASPGSGIGSASYIIPETPAAGLEDDARVYDNGPVEIYHRQEAR